jgi:aldehyde dehydrogenase (NAD+)
MEGDMVQALTNRIVTMFGDNPIDSEDLGAIVNERHYNRILGLIKAAVKLGAKLHVPGGVLELGVDKRKIAPCILTECTTDMEIMKEEIFGPVLPVLSWESKDEVLEIIAKNPNPLALYIFSSKSRNINFFTENTKAGSTAINEVIIQIANPEMGFGGIGNSGMGRSNGKASFDSFSNLRSFVSASTRFNLLPLTFPPFGRFGLRISRLIRKWG